MAFFLIVPSVMIVSVLFVHALTNRLGLRIYYPTLIAVMILSFMVTFATSSLTPAIGREYLLKLGLMILAASFLLTLANRFLLKKQQAEDKRFHEEVKAAYEAEKKKNFEVAEEKPIDKFQWGDDDISFDAPPAYNESSTAVDDKKSSTEPEEILDEKKSSTEPEEISDEKKSSTEPEEISDEKKSSTESEEILDEKKTSTESEETLDEKESSTETEEISDDKKSSTEPEEISDEKKSSIESEEILDDKKTSTESEETLDYKESSAEVKETLQENPVLPEDFPLEKIFEPLPEIKPEEADKPIKLEEKPKEEENFPLEEVFKPLSNIKHEEIKYFDTPAEKKSERTEFFPLQEVFRPLSTLNLNKLEEITQEEKLLPHEVETNPEEKIDTLDDLLDKAYDERDKGNIWQAIETYKKALERYRNDEYAPFVAIDLGNIYKDKALYSNAIKIFEEALTLPAVERNSSTKKEFVNNLEYLRVVHEVLVKHKALSTPFNKLSKEILQEIDTEFKKVQYQ